MGAGPMNVIRFRPLTAWPYPETEPRRSRYIFKAGWENTLTLLERELNHLDADNVIIGAFLRETDIRQDGFPRASARTPDHPGVEVSFDSPHGRLVYATDVCETYQHNVRSIALGLASLRHHPEGRAVRRMEGASRRHRGSRCDDDPEGGGGVPRVSRWVRRR
jgi:hypothetical protein